MSYSLLDRRPENFMVQYCKDHNIALLPYGVNAGGFYKDEYIGVSARKIRVQTIS